MRGLLGIVLSLVPIISFSEPLDYRIDYEALFEVYADQVEQETLELPAGVVVQRRGEAGRYTYVGTDKSQAGAVGCVLLLVIELEAYRRACPAIASAPQSARMESALARITAFAAENTYPPAPLPEYRAAIEAEIEKKQNQTSFSAGESCTAQPDISLFITNLFDENSEELFDELLEMPRLPVLNPCL